jgi:hypothetical protein
MRGVHAFDPKTKLSAESLLVDADPVRLAQVVGKRNQSKDLPKAALGSCIQTTTPIGFLREN